MSPDDRDALDKLSGGQEGRARTVSVNLPTDGPISETKLREASAAAKAHVDRRGYTYAVLVKKLGSTPDLRVNEAYLSAYLTGKFEDVPGGTLPKLARALNAFIEIDEARRGRRSETRFVHTKVARRLINVANQVLAANDIAICHAPAGTGKTATLQELTKLIPGSVYVYVAPNRASKTGLTKALCAAVWGKPCLAQIPPLDDLLERLRDSDRLIMLDNADVLEPSAYPVIMALHDVAHVPILIVGTADLVRKLMHDADPLRGQMSSRIGLRAELLRERTAAPRGGRRSREWISADEIRGIFERGKVKLHPRVVDRLKQIANYEIGSLRRCGRYVSYALVALGQAETKLITPEILDAAMRLVDGDEAPIPMEEAPDEREVAVG